MKFLFLTREDCAGVAHKFKVAADSLPGHSAHSVSLYKTKLDYPVDVFMPGGRELARLREWADAIVMFDGWPRKIELATRKPLAVIYNGTAYRKAWRGLNRRDAASGIVQFGTTIDLACPTYGSSLNWLPVPMKVVRPAPEKTTGVFHVFHSPTHRGLKGTERVIEELDGLDGVMLEIVEGVTNAECLRRKAKAHLLVDQFYLGYGVNALEAWALGMPVIGWVKKLPPEYKIESPGESEISKRFLEITGMDLFALIADVDIDNRGDLRATVEYMRSSICDASPGDTYGGFRDRGAFYLKKFHSAESAIGRLVSALEKGV